ncbi:MAG TPA: radical SAM protein [Candidatus Margulisiibacteriota bacterium]|nr:radical SAM protein [Candidatus Margulisiibacteriota bacterium]
MKYVYGPVASRRIGLSLGLSLTPYKTCDFDCIYCQLGSVKITTTERKEYIPIDEIADELKTWLEGNKEKAAQLQYITLSGSGEPTLNLKTGELISRIKEMTQIPVALISNASLFIDPLLRRQIAQADLIVPSLDAVTEEIFQMIDRPDPRVKLTEVIEGLVALRKEFSGKIWLEIMLVKGVNDDLRHIRKIKAVIERIRPDKVQLNSPVRSSAQQNVSAVAKTKMEKIKGILGDKAEIV